GSAAVSALIRQLTNEYQIAFPQKSVPLLVKIYKELLKLDSSNIYVSSKKEEIKEIIKDCLGLWFETTSSDFSSSPGEFVDIKTSVVKQSDFPVMLNKIQWHPTGEDSLVNQPLELNEARNFT